MIVIVDYGMGNLGSVLNMLKKIGTKARISSSVEDIEKADKLILPGVGAFDNGIKHLKKLNLLSVLNEKVLNCKTPILGICLGMQLLSQESEEGVSKGLCWIDGKVIKFKFNGNDQSLKIPHMGWNLAMASKQSKLLQGFDREIRFYFVHSYHMICSNKSDALMETEYGYRFISAVQCDNIFGVQFHPEKSHRFGMKLLKNFCELS